MEYPYLKSLVKLFSRATCPRDPIGTVMLILVDREELISYLFYDLCIGSQTHGVSFSCTNGDNSLILK